MAERHSTEANAPVKIALWLAERELSDMLAVLRTGSMSTLAAYIAVAAQHGR